MTPASALQMNSDIKKGLVIIGGGCGVLVAVPFLVLMAAAIAVSFSAPGSGSASKTSNPRSVKTIAAGDQIPDAIRDEFAEANHVFKVKNGKCWNDRENEYTDNTTDLYFSPDIDLAIQFNTHYANSGRYKIFDGRTVDDKDLVGFMKDTGYSNTYQRAVISSSDDGFRVSLKESRDTIDLVIHQRIELETQGKKATQKIWIAADPESPLFTQHGVEDNPATVPKTIDVVECDVVQIR